MNDLIENAKKDIEAGQPVKTTVRLLLSAFGGQRRRTNIVENIRGDLTKAGLTTIPDFTSTWIDAEIAIVAAPQDPQPAGAGQAKDVVQPEAQPEVAPKEAKQLIRMLSAANRGVLSVKPQDSLEVAITIMLAHDFSQLPVMTGPRDLKGVVSWKSIGGRLSQHCKLTSVSDAMEPGVVVKETASLFEVTPLIIRDDFVFVEAPDKRIVGIVTATDLSEQFQTLAEPFLLIGQIENQIRSLMHGRFDLETLRAGCNDNDPDRKARIQGVADLSIGEYIRILQVKENWEKLNFVADRVTFINELDQVRNIRNDVMHFDPDGIEDDQFDKLRRFSSFLSKLQQLSAGRAPA